MFLDGKVSKTFGIDGDKNEKKLHTPAGFCNFAVAILRGPVAQLDRASAF